MRAATRILPSLLMLALTTAGCTRTVSYEQDVKPILDTRCLECHQPGGKGYEKSGFSVETYDALMKGTQYGPVIVPGSSVSSTLVRMVERLTDPKIHMPHQKDPLSEQEIHVIRTWIDQGAKNN